MWECWNIFGLEEFGRNSKMRARPSRWPRTGNRAVTLSNRFLELAEVDEEVNENGHVNTDCWKKVDCHANGKCHVKTDCRKEVDCHANGNCHVKTDCRAKADYHMRVDGRAGEM